APANTPERTVVTTRSSAFCCGVSAAAAASTASPASTGASAYLTARQRHGERRAGVGRRLHGQRAVQPLDDLLADVEAEPGAADAAAHLHVEAVELLEDALLLGGGYPDALVDDGDLDALRFFRDEDVHPAPVGPVLDRVLDEVDEDLAEKCFVLLEEHRVRRRLEHDHFPLVRTHPRRFRDRAADGRRVDH